ncbi:hypothetical protein KJ865_00040 [Myxococcota bacterium]|nr:hypothetical protein [Myxococcota bacterium]
MAKSLFWMGVLIMLTLVVTVRASLLSRHPAGPATSVPLADNQLDMLQRAVENSTIFFFRLHSASDRLYRDYQLRKSLGRADADKPLMAIRNGLTASRSSLFSSRATYSDVRSRLQELGISTPAVGALRPFPLQRVVSLLLILAWSFAIILFIFKGLSPGLTLHPRWAARSAVIYAVSFTLWIISIRSTP